MSEPKINGHEVVSREEVVDTTNMLRITMEQDGCLIEVQVPTTSLPDLMFMKEYMQNTAVDMYARLRHMMTSREE